MFIVCILLGISPASDCSLPTFRNPLSFPFSRTRCEVWSMNSERRMWYLYPGRGLLELAEPTGRGHQVVGGSEWVRRCGGACYTRLLYLPLHTSPTLSRPLPYAPSPIGPASSSKPRPGYKYHVFLSLSTLRTLHPALEDGTDRGFRNVGKQQSDAGEIPKRIHTIFKIRRKFEIKNNSNLLCSTSPRTLNILGLSTIAQWNNY